MKKITMSILAGVTITAISTISFGATGKVNTDTARIRSEASSDSSIVDLLSIDDKVEIIEESGDWYKIKSGEKTGFVSKSLLDVEGTVDKKTTNTTVENTTSGQTNSVEQTTTEENKKEENNAKNNETTTIEKTESTGTSKITEKYVGKTSSEITIKILPSINSTDIAKIEKDAQITVIEILNDWCHIETNTYSGWTRVKIVENAISSTDKQEEATTEESKEETTETKVGYVNVDSVNLRKDKSADSEKLDSLTKNTEVTILGEEDGWYKVKVKDQTGYISKEYISDKKVDEVSSRASDTARQIMEAKAAETQEAPVSSPLASSSNGGSVVSLAKQYLGYNYVSAGKSPSTGFDCSGFTSYVYKQFGVSLSGSSSGQANAGTHVSKSDLEPGDLLIFNNSSNSSVGHVGIYIGDDEFIHAANGSKGVITTSLSSSYYEARYVDARRVLD